jgi:hypothetical protein
MDCKLNIPEMVMVLLMYYRHYTEIRVTRKGRILHVSESVPGSVHDFELLKRGNKIPKDTREYVDSGYQGDTGHP